MFDNLFSLGSIFAITVSVMLTIKSLKVNNIKNKRINSPDIIGDNNQVIINTSAIKELSDFKQLSNIIIISLMVVFPLFPNFFMTFIPTFSFCAVMICIIGVFKNIQQKGHNAAYGLVYIPIAALMRVLSISAIYSAISGRYVFTDFYSRFFDKIQLVNISFEYLSSLNILLFEATAYVGMSILFASLIHVCFGFIKSRNFDETVDFIKFWIPFSIMGHFMASGCLIAILHSNFQYITNIYKDIISNFIAYLL